MNFLGALANQITSTMSLGENSNDTLDSIVDNKVVKYGALGGFADKFDQSSQRRYIEEGYLRKDPFNTVPKQFEISTQEPNATILVKKRMFSTVAQNFRPDFMDADEKLYYRCVKILFQNKCNQIANLEKLSKLQKVTSLVGEIDNYMIPLILTLTDSFSKEFENNSILTEGEGASLVQVVDRLRRIYSYNMASPHTSWIVDNNNLLKSKYAEGTGVIELNNFTNLNTSLSVDLRSGSCSFNISDPYQMMLITEYDIEKAISDATNLFYSSKTYQLGKENSELLISELQTRLNQYRKDRGASPISFKLNPDTLLGKRVTAIIDRQAKIIPFTYNALGSLLTLGLIGGANVGVEVPSDYLYTGTSNIFLGIDGLDNRKKSYGYTGLQDAEGLGYKGNNHSGMDSELNLFCRLIKAIFDRLALIANSESAFQTKKDNTIYSRKKLTFNFLGKKLVQPMDAVHVYISSKSKIDNSILGGLNTSFNGYGFLQKAFKSLSDLKNSFTSAFNPERNLNLQIEKAAFVGKEFPSYLWNMLRSQFVSENEGIHVFGGVVKETTDDWNQGNYTVSVSCADNSAFFEMGKVNFSPGVDVFNGSIYDPLTPFKSNFDQVTNNTDTLEFLEENKALLSVSVDDTTPLVKQKQGPSVGLPLTAKSIIQDKAIDPTTGLLTRTFYAPDGLVYKWKEGIGVHVQYGDSENINSTEKVGSVNIRTEPFDGLDVMNVISLLITGIPYNFATYWKAIKSPDFSGDSSNNEGPAKTFYDSLSESLQKNNLLWGNFIPFKSLTIDDETEKRLRTQCSIQKQNADLDSKISEWRDIQDKLSVFGVVDLLNNTNKGLDSDNSTSSLVLLKEKATKIKAEVDGMIKKLREEDESYFVMFGDDVIYDVSNDFDTNIISKSNKNDENQSIRSQYRKALRRQVNFLSRRMSYNVRANEDKNLFIVDDQYDKDYDILAYNLALTKEAIKLFNNAFTSVKEKITNTANLLNLEVFCDTQGHIRVRPPQYNRMPSSVFYKMMYMKDALGIQMFPDFLNTLFTNQVETIKNQIETTEDYIRFYASLLGYDTDQGVYTFLRSYTANQKTGEGSNFLFVSNEDGNIIDIQYVMKGANPDLYITDQSLKSVEQQAKTRKDAFRTSDRAQALVDVLETKKLNSAGFSINEVSKVQENQRTQDLIDRIYDRSREKLNSKDYILTNKSSYGEFAGESYAVDAFKVLSELSTKIADRQKLVKTFYATLKNYTEYKSLDKQSNKMFAAGNYGNSNIPEVLEYMIEDENYDDLGPGSGKRYIISRSKIKKLTISESVPDYTYVEVSGQIRYLPNATNIASGSFPKNGNAITTASAIDYDMWRNYGLIKDQSIAAPFLQDPIKQCAPYAAMLLSKARKEIFRGTVEIVGNEYMQPGDVVYIEDRNMLFYVQSVNHSFSFGNQFTTTLGLTYGHSPGEFIPTTLDIIGKMIYNNRDVGNLVINRQSSSFNESPLGVVIYDNNHAVINNTTDPNSFSTKYSASNLKTINNILYSVQYYINNTSKSTNKKVTRVELRTYYDNDNPQNSDLDKFVESVKNVLKGENVVANNTSFNLSSKKSTTAWIKNENALVSVPVNRSDPQDPKSPSQKAINAAREIITTSNNPENLQFSTTSDPNNTGVKVIQLKNKLKTALSKYIVDCWVVFEDESSS